MSNKTTVEVVGPSGRKVIPINQLTKMLQKGYSLVSKETIEPKKAEPEKLTRKEKKKKNEEQKEVSEWGE